MKGGLGSGVWKSRLLLDAHTNTDQRIRKIHLRTASSRRRRPGSLASPPAGVKNLGHKYACAAQLTASMILRF